MFTGIIEAIGRIKRIDRTGQSYRIDIASPEIAATSKRGDSISVNGVCLTIEALQANYFSADIMPETVTKTIFSTLKPGSTVNLERALTPATLMGGHIVQGHVDGIGKVRSIKTDGEYWVITITVDQEIIRYMAPKGSVAVNGVSLTIVDVNEKTFSVSVIPTTLKDTTIGQLHDNEVVNIEVDVIGKYVYHYVNQAGTSTGISREFLYEHGF